MTIKLRDHVINITGDGKLNLAIDATASIPVRNGDQIELNHQVEVSIFTIVTCWILRKTLQVHLRSVNRETDPTKIRVKMINRKTGDIFEGTLSDIVWNGGDIDGNEVQIYG